MRGGGRRDDSQFKRLEDGGGVMLPEGGKWLF